MSSFCRITQPTAGRQRCLVALFGAAAGYGIMILAMTATPLALAHHHHDLPTTATVIQLHVLGMFLPSFFTGSQIARFGVLRIMLTGVQLFAGHIMVSLTGTGFSSFASALILLGVGWNFLYIGGTTLLTTTYTSAEKGRAQALNMLLLPWMTAAGLALVWLGWRNRRLARSP